MKVHIIRDRPNGTMILSRKAQVLRDELGWGLSATADPAADLQYAFCYLDYKDRSLPFAAYFTHREDMRADKVLEWEQAAKKAVLRVTSAQQYYNDLQEYGPTVKILPPLDREKFSIPAAGVKPAGKRPVVGVSGYVYSGGRKGEWLLDEVMATDAGKAFEWRACGKGWPIPTKQYKFDQLQDFYRYNIDILLCTALIEGVPYPPLEALACGRPVVIPYGVGLMDELPEMPGIERYKAGDVEDMLAALDRAAAAQVKPEELRAATEPFDQLAWAKSHADAFAEVEQVLLHTKRSEKPTQADRLDDSSINRRKDRGIYVVAYGAAARNRARVLVNSVRRYMPDIPVAVASEEPLTEPEADHWIQYDGDPGVGARLVKLNAYNLAPASWQQVLYLDADTELTESVDYLFYCLDQGWEAVLVKEVNKNHRHIAPGRDYEYTLETIGRPEGNDAWLAPCGGVIAFKRCAAAKRFFDTWLQEYGEGQARDQPSLLRAWFKTKLRAWFVGNEWNSFTKHAHENRYRIIKHYSGTARSGRSGETVKVINTGSKAVERAGHTFYPGATVLVNKQRKGFNEILACNSLQIVRK